MAAAASGAAADGAAGSSSAADCTDRRRYIHAHPAFHACALTSAQHSTRAPMTTRQSTHVRSFPPRVYTCASRPPGHRAAPFP
eukprot:365519-Chlamydomonas_euryale.AAC.3